MKCIFITILLFTHSIFALDIIPFDTKNWTKFEKLQSLKINRPVLINKNLNGVGVITEETQPKDENNKIDNWCKQFEGKFTKNYCRANKSNSVTFIFRKEFPSGIFFQSVTFEDKDSKLINKFESGLK